MTEPINRKTEARKRSDAEGAPTPQQRAVIERYLKRRDSRPDAPRLIVDSKPNQPVEISQPSSADGAGLALAFGTTEAGVANILLNSLINAACDGTPGHPPSEQDINGVLRRRLAPLPPPFSPAPMLRHVVYASLLHFGVETAVVFGGWNFDQRSPSTSDVHLGLRKAARGWLKAVALLHGCS
jgi:hypothetical protein